MAIEFNNYVKNLRDDDVLDIDHQLFKAEKFKSSFKEAWNEKIVPERFNDCTGIANCEVNRAGQVS